MPKGYVVITKKSGSHQGHLGETERNRAMSETKAEQLRRSMIDKNGFDSNDVEVVEIDADYVSSD